MNLDYLTSNALNKYPFEDSASLKATNSTFLSNDTFLDLIVVSKDAELVGAYLSQYSSNTGTQEFNIQIVLTDKDDQDVEVHDIVIPFSSVAEKAFYGVATDFCATKIVFGPGFVRDKLASVSKTFVLANARVEQSAFIQMVPRVTSVAFYNWNKNTNLPQSTPLTTITGDEESPIDLILEAGSNMSMVQSGTTATLNVIRGAGTGLHDGCVDPGLVIKRINAVGPDQNSNFLFTTDDCYTTTPLEHGLAFENICTPKCTREQIAGYAYYLNRVVDGMDWVTDYAHSVAQTIKDEIDRYNTDVLPLKNQPKYKLKYEKYPTIDAGRFYFSFAVGFFNPTNDDLTVNVTMSTTASMVLNSRRFRIENNTQLLSANAVNIVVPCLKVGILEFVVSASTTKTVTVAGTFGSLAINNVTTIL